MSQQREGQATEVGAGAREIEHEARAQSQAVTYTGNDKGVTPRTSMPAALPRRQ
jgi:hypothetical protein